MSIRKILLITFIGLSFSLLSQESNKIEVKPEFKIKGKAIVRVFANYHSNLGGTEQTAPVDAMKIKRAYLGYKAHISENYTIKVVFDVGNTNGRYNTYLKIAGLNYKKGKFSYNIGMIATKQFKVQEKFWGYRYFRKSFQDQYKYNASADIGFSVDYKLIDGLSIDGIIQNGGGYKHVDPTGTYRGGVGATINIYKPLTFRLYYDISVKPDIKQQSIVTFLAYKFGEKLKIAAEYNYQLNNKFAKDHNMFGYSTYATYSFNPKFDIFARYDNSQSNIIEDEGSRLDPQAWNVNKDENVAIVGFQYKPTSRVKLSINYRRVQSAIADMDAVNWMFFNLEFKL